MHVVSIKYLKRKYTSYIYSVLSKNRGYAPGLALGRRRVSKVSIKRLWSSLLHEDLLLVLLNDLAIMFIHRHELYQLMIYMHEMIMQHLVIRQQQLLK